MFRSERLDLTALWGLSVVIVAAALIAGYWFPRRPGCDEPSEPLPTWFMLLMLAAAPFVVYVVLPLLAPSSAQRLLPHALAVTRRVVARFRRRSRR